MHEVFGFDALREGQARVIASVLEGRDTLAVMPTGAGKSLCYQLPALHLPGTTVVVSPLIALMKDQVDKLGDTGIDAEQLNSAQPQRAQHDALQRLQRGDTRIVFATPERLADDGFRQTLQQQPVALFVIDEAHCISQWGHDFRPAYLELGRALKELGDPPVLALTATATDDVVADLRRQLGRPALEVVATGVYRPNLRLQVVRCTREEEKFAHLQEALSRAQGAGIVYTTTVKNCVALHQRLQGAGEAVSLYHGRLGARERAVQQQRFMSGESRVMVATAAFGMGIDRTDIRFIVHHQIPGSLKAYYQEAGRAGRDGAAADCALLYWRQDRQVQRFFLARSRPDAAALAAAFDAVASAESAGTQATLAGLLTGRAASDRPKLAASLAVLRAAGLLRCDRARRWRRTGVATPTKQAFESAASQHVERDERDHEALERMVFYAQTGFCRWRVLLESFNEPRLFDAERCGHCDNCLQPTVVAAAEPATPTQRPPPAQPAFAHGQPVHVPRYGEGCVDSVAGDEVGIVFADGQRRRFMAHYVHAKQ